MIINRLDRRGAGKALVIAFIMLLLLFISSALFGGWAYSGLQDYKHNTDGKIKKAVTVAKLQAETAKDNEYFEKAKQPFKDYSSASVYGSVYIKYPKTWSGYISEDTNNSVAVNAYFHPNYVPANQGQTAFALRLEIINTSYDLQVQQQEGNIKSGQVTATAFRPANVPSALGLKLDGNIYPQKRGSMVILPVRDKTLIIWTEAEQFVKDFNNSVLPSLTFSP